MICPRCNVAFRPEEGHDRLVHSEAPESLWVLGWETCPECNQYAVTLSKAEVITGDLEGGVVSWYKEPITIIHPVLQSGANRRVPAPPEVPAPIAEDYNEACAVFPSSAKASAALSRRCLQSILRDAGEVTYGDLSKEIQQVLDRGTLPTYIAQAIDGIRIIGNFAAHPVKSQVTGEIVGVEPGEAEWLLDVLETLFDFYYVQPVQLEAKRQALNAKLTEAGKPPMK